MLLSYATYLETKEEVGQYQCCPASGLTCLLVLLVCCRRPLAKSSASPLLAPAPLLRPPSSLGTQPALLPPLPVRLSLCPVPRCCCRPRWSSHVPPRCATPVVVL